MLLAAYHLYNRCVHALVFTVCVCVVRRVLHVLHMLRSCPTEPRFIANVTIVQHARDLMFYILAFVCVCMWHVCASVWMQWVHWVWCGGCDVVCDFSSIVFPPRICKARSTLCAQATVRKCALGRVDFLHKYKQIYIDMIEWFSGVCPARIPRSQQKVAAGLVGVCVHLWTRFCAFACPKI